MTIPSNNPEVAKLDSFLASRPEAQELVNRGIMKDGKLAPALQQQADELSKRHVEDVLRHKIDQRPTREQLVEQNILKDTEVAPALQRSQMDLERHRLENAMDHKIADRPDPSKLVERGILQESDAPQA
ncbi:hypothetical protein BC940DRAFT_297219 [Gongronella butleri]|nr:hypothetical protein BC940DRAFT_297219 [Gongronella butleri]